MIGELAAQGLIPAWSGAEDREGQAESLRHNPEEGVSFLLHSPPRLLPLFQGIGAQNAFLPSWDLRAGRQGPLEVVWGQTDPLEDCPCPELCASHPWVHPLSRAGHRW